MAVGICVRDGVVSRRENYGRCSEPVKRCRAETAGTLPIPPIPSKSREAALSCLVFNRNAKRLPENLGAERNWRLTLLGCGRKRHGGAPSIEYAA